MLVIVYVNFSDGHSLPIDMWIENLRAVSELLEQSQGLIRYVGLHAVTQPIRVFFFIAPTIAGVD